MQRQAVARLSEYRIAFSQTPVVAPRGLRALSHGALCRPATDPSRDPAQSFVSDHTRTPVTGLRLRAASDNFFVDTSHHEGKGVTGANGVHAVHGMR